MAARTIGEPWCAGSRAKTAAGAGPSPWCPFHTIEEPAAQDQGRRRSDQTGAAESDLAATAHGLECSPRPEAVVARWLERCSCRRCLSQEIRATRKPAKPRSSPVSGSENAAGSSAKKRRVRNQSRTSRLSTSSLHTMVAQRRGVQGPEPWLRRHGMSWACLARASALVEPNVFLRMKGRNTTFLVVAWVTAEDQHTMG